MYFKCWKLCIRSLHHLLVFLLSRLPTTQRHGISKCEGTLTIANLTDFHHQGKALITQEYKRFKALPATMPSLCPLPYTNTLTKSPQHSHAFACGKL